jgi:hypothetical protein
MTWSVAPYFIVDDVVVTANFYRDKLGFHYERFWGEPPCFCMVKRGGIIIMLSQLAAPGLMRPNRLVDPNGEAWDAYVWVGDADTLCSVLLKVSNCIYIHTRAGHHHIESGGINNGLAHGNTSRAGRRIFARCEIHD